MLFNKCNKCFFDQSAPSQKIKKLKKSLIEIFKKNNIAEVIYKLWVSKPYSTLENKTESLDEFVDSFILLGRKFLHHSLIASKQAERYKLKKKNLKPDECLVVCDFAENYPFVAQNAVPGYHFNNNQATLFPIVFYYNDDGTIKHKTIITISNCRKHDAIAVYLFIKGFNEYLDSFFPQITKCIYFSDGAPQQFKNLHHFSTIYYHEQDFGRSAKWHFQATAHGKGPSDGAGGALKRKARRASLQGVSIMSSLELYEWAKKSESSMSVLYKDTEDYEKIKQFLESRFETCQTIKGTQQIHYIQPKDNGMLITRLYSSSGTSVSVDLFKKSTKRKRK